MADSPRVEELEARLERCEAREAELRRLLVAANEELVRVERRRRPLHVRSREAYLRARRSLGRLYRRGSARA